MINFSPLIIGTMRLGVWGANLDSSALERFIDECLDMGLNDFDHADIYGHYTEEERFGAVIKRRPDLKSKIQVTTKCGIQLVTPNRPQHQLKSYNLTKAHIIQSVEHSLKTLGLDVLDVLLLHRPDYLMQPVEIAEAFEQLKASGKVKAFGVSNFSATQFDLLNSFTPLITNQIELSLLHRQALDNGTLDQLMRLGLSPTIWSPFGGGAIFGTANTPEIIRIQEVAKHLSEKYDASIDQLLLAWLLKHPSGIIPIIGSSKIARIKQAKAALSIQLSHEDWYKLLESAVGAEVA